MKKSVLALVMLLAFNSIKAQNKNLPSPDSDMQTVPQGSYVIAMDNTLQANASGYFNLKTYGLVVHLLNNNIRIRWAIKAGKAKDGIDFTGFAEQILPSLVVGGVSRDFKAGPFVIYASDTAGVAALVQTYYTANSLSGNDRPSVYMLTASVLNVDIRYDLLGFKPKAIVLTDGTNASIHLNYMTLCGIPAANYGSGPATDLYTRCYTFASEPHNHVEHAPTISAIKHFVQQGGNFLGQCQAVETYENSSYGRFHSTNGISKSITPIAESAPIYPNPDLAFSQFQGTYYMSIEGYLRTWVLASGSSFQNNEHNHMSGGTIASQTPIGASVAKLTASSMPGGMVFYLGTHAYTSVTNNSHINGMRMYMNAMLTPVAINSTCNTGDELPNPLPVKLADFTATFNQDQSKVQLQWATVTETNSSHFVVEKSTDGASFTETGMVITEGNSIERKDYSFTDNIANVKATVLYYRLKQVDIDGKSELSSVRMVRITKPGYNDLYLQAFPNPATDYLKIAIPAEWVNKRVYYELLTSSGAVVKRTENALAAQVEIFNVGGLASGMYVIRATSGGETLSQKIIKR